MAKRISMLSWPFAVRRACGKWYTLLAYILLFAACMSFGGSDGEPNEARAVALLVVYSGAVLVASWRANNTTLAPLGKTLSQMRGHRIAFFAEAANHRYVTVVILALPIIFVIAAVVPSLLLPDKSPEADAVRILMSLAILTLLFCAAAYWVFRRDTEAAWRKTVAEGRPFALYLRTFSKDSMLMTGAVALPDQLSGFERAAGRLFSLERTIYRAVLTARLAGVAVGAPGENLPPLGFHRLYFDDASWQDAVSDLIGKSAVVLVDCAPTKWVAWELKEIARRDAISKLVLLNHARTASERAANLDFALKALGRSDIEPDPRVMGIADLSSNSPILVEAYHDDLFAFMDVTTVGLYVAMTRGGKASAA